VEDGHRVYWETWGSPKGKPAVVLHGGPGSGSSPGLRLLFDLDRYWVIFFDQRGCGRSTPHASEGTQSLVCNTTAHLIADIERLRVFLAIEAWLVFGQSWGSTLGLAYAERHPDRVTELVLAGVTMTRPSELRWHYRHVAPLLPAEWEQFRLGVPEADRDGDLVDAYHRLLFHPDSTVQAEAARRWSEWDWAVSVPDRSASPDPRWSDPRFRLARARIVTHYFRHQAWLEDGVLLQHADRLAGIPGVMVHGRLDLGSPLATAWDLDRAWPDGALVVVEGAGHSVAHEGITSAIIDATSKFTAKKGDIQPT
jgi:proline iminopeptidase